MSSRPTRLLLAAFPPELAGLAGRLAGGWRAACVGVGAVSAAAATARLLAERRPERVLFVGTCGAYDARLAIGDHVSAAEAAATSLDEVEGRASRPEREPVRWRAGWELPFPAHVVAVTPGVTLSAAGARALGRVAAAEHLELAGVFAACSAAGVPAAAALAVANRVGPGARAEWKANHRRVSRELGEALRALVRMREREGEARRLRVAALAPPPVAGTAAEWRAAAAARSATRKRRSSLTSRTAASTRSRAMESTSRPT